MENIKLSSSYNTTKDGEIITIQDGSLKVPDKPIIPFIEGDGIGADVWRASRRVLDAAIEKAYDNQRAINWVEALAGEKAFNKTGEWLPSQTLEMCKKYLVAIKALNYPHRRRFPLPERHIETSFGPIRLYKTSKVV